MLPCFIYGPGNKSLQLHQLSVLIPTVLFVGFDYAVSKHFGFSPSVSPNITKIKLFNRMPCGTVKDNCKFFNLFNY
jgi:hypothetical protein